MAARDTQEQQSTHDKYDKIHKRLVQLFRELDEDNSGELSVAEIVSGLDEDGSAFSTFLQDMQVTPKDIDMIFQMLDEDGSGSIELDEFVDGLHRMKTESDRTLLQFIRHYTFENKRQNKEQREVIDRMDICITDLCSSMGKLLGFEQLRLPKEIEAVPILDPDRETEIPPILPLTPLQPSMFNASLMPLNQIIDSVHADIRNAQTTIDRKITEVLQDISLQFECRLKGFSAEATFRRGVGHPCPLEGPTTPRMPSEGERTTPRMQETDLAKSEERA